MIVDPGVITAVAAIEWRAVRRASVWVWDRRPHADVLIGWWALVIASAIVARAGRGTVVTLGGLLVVVTPAYAALFWLIHDHQGQKDRIDALERELDHDTPSTGRHAMTHTPTVDGGR